MHPLLGLAKRNIPLQNALPWLWVVSFIPFWLIFPAKLIIQITSIGESLMFPHPLESPGTYYLHDFQPFWAAGKLIWLNQSQMIYHSSAFWAWRQVHWDAKSPWMLQYFYPPPSLILPIMVSPFSRLAGFFVWQAINLVPSAFLLRRLKRPWWFIVLCFMSPALMFNTWIAQLGILTGVAFITGLMIVEEQPICAGLLLGALVIKPQAGLLGALVLIARKQRQSLLTGLILVVSLSVAVTLICGWPIWQDYLVYGRATARVMLFAPFSSNLQVSGLSVFWMVRSFGASIDGAIVAQGASAIIAASWCWTAWRQPETNRVALVALTVALTLLATPYGYTTDMCGLTIMTAWLAWDRRQLDVADVLIFAWPVLCPALAGALHVELTPLVLLLAAIRAWKRLTGIGITAPACYPISL